MITNIFASGGFGDALIILNKAQTLKKRIPNSDPRIHFYTTHVLTAKLIGELFTLNCWPNHQTYVVENLDHEIKLVKDQNAGLIITTVWNGIIPEDDYNALKVFTSDKIEVSPVMDLQGIATSVPETLGSYILVQLDAGMQYHNPRKHWENINLLLQFTRSINKKYNIKAVIIGRPKGFELPVDNFLIDISDLGFQSIEFIKHAQCVLCLSGFVALASLMLNKQTIMKYETEFINERYYGHPEWKKRLHLVEELNIDSQRISKIIEQNL